MAPDNPDQPATEDEALDRLQDLAERLAAAVAERDPDWRGIVRWARELARRAEARCSGAGPSASVSG